MTSIKSIETLYGDPRQQQDAIDDLFRDWYVVCSVSEQKIPLNELKYWNLDRDEVYAGSHLVPGNRKSLEESKA